MASQMADRVFWPAVAAIFDFTLKFEESIFSIAPSAVTIIMTPVLLYHYLSRQVCIRRSLLLWCKMFASSSLVAIEASILAVRCSHTEFRTSTSIPAASLELIAALALLVILYTEHLRALRPSAYVGLYITIGVLLDAAKSRSYFLRPGLGALGGLTAAAAAIRLVLLGLEEVPKTHLILDPDLRKMTGREAAAGLWTRLVFIWLNPLIWKGYRGTIHMDDIDEIGAEFSSQFLFEKFHPRWVAQDKMAKLCLARALFSHLWLYLLFTMLPRLAFTGFTFSIPFILRTMTDIITDGATASQDSRDSLVGATVLTMIGIGISRGAHEHMNYRLNTRVRGILVTEMLDKCHHISQSTANKSAAVTLMSTDLENIVTSISLIYEIPAAFIEVCLATYFLSFFIGEGCFVILFPLMISTVFGLLIGRKSGPALATWNGKIEFRVAETSKVLSQMRVIKMLGLGPTVTKYLQHLRDVEIDYSKKYRVYNAVLMCIAIFTSLLPQALVVAVGLFWTSFGGTVPPQTLPLNTIFPCLSIVALSQNPLSDLLKAYANIGGLIACLGRVQAYLLLPEWKDPRIVGAAAAEKKSDSSSSEKMPIDTKYAVQFLNASIAPYESQEPLLQGIHFGIKQSTVTVTAGASGSGKSSLLQSILGEVNLVKGDIFVEDDVIAFADQTAWIQNMSIQDNIVGHLAFDRERYDRCVQACMLNEDFEHMADGDQTMAGTNGMSLSGGQRHRVSVARAAYLDAKLVVLDDVFSSLDRKTAVSMLSNLCGGGGILRKSGATVIISTYLPECLDIADQILLLDGEGGVTLEANAQNASVRSKVKDIGSRMGVTAEKEELPVSEKPVKASKKESDDEKKLQFSRRKQDLGLYAMFVNAVGKKVFFPWIVILSGITLGEAMTNVYMRFWVANHPSTTLYYIGYVGIILGGSVAALASFSFLFLIIAPRASTVLHERLLGATMRSKVSYFATADSGFILNRFSQDMNLLSKVLPGAFSTSIYMLFHILIMFGIILAGATYSTALLPFMFLFIWVLQYCYLRTSRQMRHLDLESKTPLYTHFSETATGLRHIRAFGRQGANFQRSVDRLNTSQKPYYTMFAIQRWLSFMLDMFACAIATTVAAFALNFNKTTSAPAIGLSFLTLVYFGLALGYFINSWVNLETSVGALSRLREFLTGTPQEEQRPPKDLPEIWPTNGTVEFKNVTARYSDDTPQALRDVSFSVSPGAKVGITGRSGSGKSSMFLTLLGFLDYSGKIEIDGVDLATIPVDELRGRITTVSQENLDFGGSVRNSLDPFGINDTPEEREAKNEDGEMRKVLERLRIWEVIAKQGGLDEKLEKVGLSHGQLQLFSIARAILRHRKTKGKVVLMDEATSHVDMNSDANVQSFFREAFAGCTILVIAHRLETINDADMFVDLTHGVAEVGMKKALSSEQ